MPELVFFRRGEEVLRFGLDRSRTVLGRGDKSDVMIPDPTVSRRQAALLYDGQSTTLEDLSGKGTLVSGAAIERILLIDGSDIALGQWRAIYRERSGGAAEETTEVTGNHTAVQVVDEAPQRWQSAQIRVRQGLNEVVHKLVGEAFTVGLDPSNDIVVPDRFVSGKHLRITRKDNTFRVMDHLSTNGTFIGNVRVMEADVPLFTSLRLGETELILEPVAAARKEAAYQGIIGNDSSVRQLAELIECVAPSSAAVAIFGESGTGKELVARAVHARSHRADKPFVPVNCAAISKELIESELFGHEKGAFTGATNARRGAFEEADGGTLFLDEIGELPLDLQAKLLRALESGEIKRVGASRPTHVDVRIVAASNRDLLAACRAQRFRDDLYYRLCVIPLHLAPLRNRRGDVLALAEHFVRLFSPRGQQVGFTPSAIDRLQTHSWPGNIRELRNAVHRALLLRRGPMIDAADLSYDQEVNPETGITVPELPRGMTLEQMLEKLERQIVETALRRYNNNRERVAKELGVARSTLFKRLKDWGLTRKDEPWPDPPPS
ncbi:MAG TPA: sigma 54-interacting transcriptional regulator [Myxococcaceae bacterium]|nr:sigma 54-interacting transcriptional regulator [Myxococcaceae bacterium]